MQLNFQMFPVGTSLSNTYVANGITVLVRDFAGSTLPKIEIRNDGGFVGAGFGFEAVISFKEPVEGFLLRLSIFAVAGFVEIYDASGHHLGTVQIAQTGNLGKAGFVANQISSLIVRSPSNEVNCLSLEVFGSVSKTTVEAEAELSKEKCAEVVFGESGTLRAPGGNESALADGRKFVAAVAYDRYLDDPSRFAPPRHPTDQELTVPHIKKHWDLCVAAAAAAQGGDVGTCRHFVIWRIASDGKGPSDTPDRIDDDWPYNEASKIKEKYGPFRNPITPVGDDIYIFKYCGVAFVGA
jgi:hypothetical protein